MEVIEPRSRTWKLFSIRDRRQNTRGNWEYQLKDKATGQDYSGNDWFLEEKLEPEF
jgi:hypothetical protein